HVGFSGLAACAPVPACSTCAAGTFAYSAETRADPLFLFPLHPPIRITRSSLLNSQNIYTVIPVPTPILRPVFQPVLQPERPPATLPKLPQSTESRQCAPTDYAQSNSPPAAPY